MFKLTVCNLHELFLLLSVLCNYHVDGQDRNDILYSTTFLDGQIARSVYDTLHTFFIHTLGETGRRTEGAFLQESIDKFPCNVTNMRSDKVPDSVHRLRPGDIDVVAALGDSLTAASGASSMNLLEMLIENRGLSWSIGGQWDWRNASTLPNILKEFNPNLMGYATRDTWSAKIDSQFNVAEIGASSADMHYMAMLIVRRVKQDERIDFKNAWKMVTIGIGGNDICSFICAMDEPESLPRKYRQRLIKTLRHFRDNMPRTFVNIVSMPYVKNVIMVDGKPEHCRILHYAECSCWIGHLYNQNEESHERYHRIQMEIHEIEYNVTMMEEFRNLKEFAVVYQPWTDQLNFRPGKLIFDYSLMAFDCFHMSQKGHGWAGVALWNNLLEKPGNKSTCWASPSERFLCPTDKHPYIFTNDNYVEDESNKNAY